MKVKKLILGIFLSCLFLPLLSSSVNATTQSISPVPSIFAATQLDPSRYDSTKFSSLGINAYAPSCTAGGSDSTIQGSCGGEITSEGNIERTKEMVEKYGVLAMNLQVTYGVSWELIITQMVAESGVGVAGTAKQQAADGLYNWMGLSTCNINGGAKYGSGKTYARPADEGCFYESYTTIDNMMKSYASGDYLRNGLYDHAFPYTDKDNYDLREFDKHICGTYVGGHDGPCSDSDDYVVVTMEYLKYVREKASELGYPTTEELQKEKNIPIGGKFPIGSDNVYDDSVSCGGESSNSTPSSTPSSSTPSSSSTPNNPSSDSDCAILAKLRQELWDATSDEDKEYFVGVAYRENGAIALEGFFNQIIAYNIPSIHDWLHGQCVAFGGGVSCTSRKHSLTEEGADEGLKSVLSGSNKLRFAIGNATGGSGVGAGKIVCVWDGEKCRDDVDYNQPDGSPCSAFTSTANEECWGMEMAPDWPEKAGVAGCTGDGTSCQSVSLSWEDGWITGGIEGYTKDPYSGGDSEGDYETTSPKGGTGPNKILLHNTEGPGGQSVGESIVSSVYGDGPVVSAHFTIDIRNKRLWQHHPITKHSGALYHANDPIGGIQIEIFGYDDEEESNEWYLPSDSNFSDSDWDYLATLLAGISQETGIPLESTVKTWVPDNSDSQKLSREEFKNYVGILGHMHAPQDDSTPKEDHTDPISIWDKVEAAIKRIQSCEAETEENTCPAEDDKCADTLDESSFPNYYQANPQWADTPYYSLNGTKDCTVAICGCGPTSLAEIVTILTGDATATPDVIAGKVGNYVSGGGVADLDPDIADEYGLEVVSVDFSNMSEFIEKVKQYMSEGYLMHINGNEGDWGALSAGSGHYASLVKLDGDKVLITSFNNIHGESRYGRDSWITLEELAHIGVYTDRPVTAIRKKGSSGSNCDTIGENGLTAEQAAKLLAWYSVNKNDDTRQAITESYWDRDACRRNQCTAFSAFFVTKFTKQTLTGGTFSGSNAVSQAMSESGGGETSGEPSVFSLFEAPGHTGIVVGKEDDGTFIYANNNGLNCSPLIPDENAITNFDPEEYYAWNYGGWSSAPHIGIVSHDTGVGGSALYMKLDVDTKKLMDYINNGP